MRLKFGAFFVINLLALSSFADAADVRYVRANGSDTSNTCLSISAPCATLNQAHAQAAIGDEIQMAAGTYTLAAQQAITKAVTINGGYSADYATRSIDPASTTIAAGAAATRLFYINTGHTDWMTLDTVKISGVSNAGSLTGTILTNTGGALLKFNNVLITGNNMKGGNGAISMVISGDQLEITDSTISSNTASTTGAGINLVAGTSAVITNTKFTGNKATSTSGTNNGGAIYAIGATLSCTECDFSSNEAKNTSNVGLGGAIYSNNTKLTISDSSFDLNKSGSANGAANTAGGGAIYTEGTGIISIKQSLFSNNVSVGFGGGVLINTNNTNSSFELSNSTFFANKGSRGAAVEIAGTVPSNLAYNTMASNQSTSYEAAGLCIAGAAPTKLTGSLIVGNTAGYIKDIRDFNTPAKLVDGGYNIVGLVGAAEVESGGSSVFATVFNSGKSSIATGTLADIFDPATLQNNGGRMKSLKLKSTSIARDKIDNDGLLFYGMGQSAANPFTSLQQAHGALKYYKDYAAGIYYFDLGGSYNASYVFTAGAKPFTSYVDDNGWVLIASGDNNNTTLVAYAQTYSLTEDSDSILNSAILTDTNFKFGEVRISTGKSVIDELNITSSNANVITAVKTFKMLPNNFTYANAWITDKGYVHMDGQTCATNSGTAKNLNEVIFEACGDSKAAVWAPIGILKTGFYYGETQDVSVGTHTADMNLWVRGTSGVCDGSVTTKDMRGLPRSDYANPNDPNQYSDINKCDVGAFEFNDGYKYDCYSEDGLRASNFVKQTNANGDITGGEVKICYGDTAGATPNALINSVGSVNEGYILLLFLIGLGFQCRRYYFFTPSI